VVGHIPGSKEGGKKEGRGGMFSTKSMKLLYGQTWKPALQE